MPKRARADAAAAASDANGEVVAVFVKSRKGKRGRAREIGKITLIAHEGIEGDCHADPLSPRQVLLATSRAATSLGVEPGQLQENIHINEPSSWPPPSGTVIRIGDTCELRVTFKCEPCSFGAKHAGIKPSTKFTKDLCGDWERTACRGLFATVLTGGVIHPRDKVAVLPAPRYEPLDIAEPGTGIDLSQRGARVRALIRVIPRRRVTTYSELCKMAGADPGAYARAIPKCYLANPMKPEEEGEPWRAIKSARHRVLDTDRCVQRPCSSASDGKPRVDMLKQPALLSKELGINLDLKKGGKQVVPESWMWRPTHAQLFLRPEGTATPWPMPPPKLQVS